MIELYERLIEVGLHLAQELQEIVDEGEGGDMTSTRELLDDWEEAYARLEAYHKDAIAARIDL